MVNYIIYIIAFIITFPVIATIAVYQIMWRKGRHKRKAFHQSINWTTIFYIIAVTILLNNTFNHYYIGVIFLVLLLTYTVIIVYQWKAATEINYRKAFRLLWRICFLVFLLMYIILLLIGIINNIFFY